MVKKVNRLALVAGLVASGCMGVHAAEARLTGTLKAQIDYQNEAEDDRHWFLATPGNELGALAVEPLAGGQFYGVLNYRFYPQSEEFQQRHAYLAWQQASVGVLVGQIPSLQYSFLVQPVRTAEALDSGALSVSRSSLYTDNERDAVRVEWQAGEAFVFAAQWLIADADAALPASLVSSLVTPEGTLTATYHRPTEADAFWGAQVTYLAGQLELAATGLYQDSWRAWDVQLTLVSQNTRSYASYGVLEQNEGQWQLGVHQQLTPSLLSYTEYAIRADRGHVWTQGFKLSF